MPSFSSLFTSLTGAGFFYEKNPRHATYNFNQDAQSLYRNHPRFPFEYYININFNNVGSAKSYIAQYFNSADLAQIMPLVKTVDMPSMKVDTATLNQYNRKRMTQTKLSFEPVKIVFHDVADGKTLKLWDMYYRYYFADGIEAGKNESKQSESKAAGNMSVDQLIKNLTPTVNPAIKNLLFNTPIPKKATNTNGDKSIIQNIVSNTLDNHNFGFNVRTVGNVRNLIQSIDIYQVHGGRFNQVTLVNPRVSAFTHDVLSYAVSDKTLELTFTFEYEYAYYTIQNMRLGGSESNNTSNIEQFSHGEALELPSLGFNARLLDFVESNNPLLASENPLLQRVGKNTQVALGNVTGGLAGRTVKSTSSSALSGLADVSPPATRTLPTPAIQTRPFNSTAVSRPSNSYVDVSRIKGSK